MFRSAIVRRAMPAARRFYSAGGDNAFVRERKAVEAHALANAQLWKKISIFGAIPCLIGAGINAWYLWKEHWDHWDHLPPMEERTEYPYQNIRTIKYQWGEGDQTIFWNPKVNYHNKDKVV